MEEKGPEAAGAGAGGSDEGGVHVRNMKQRLFDAERDVHHARLLERRVKAGAMVDEETGAVNVAQEGEYYYEEKPRMRDPCCRKFTFRLYSSFVCCWILPLLTFAPAYFLLSYRDTNGDYREFELPVCRNSIAFYCIDGATTAGLLRGVAVWPPFFYTVVVGNLYLLHRAKRARDDYIAGRHRENARRVRKDFLTKWESAAVRERRLAREQVIFDKKIEMERERRRREYFTLEFFQAARRRLKFEHGSALEAVCWYLGRRRRLRWANLYWAIGVVVFIVIPVTTLLPAFVDNYDRLSTFTPGDRGKRAVLAVVVIVFPLLALVILGPTVYARARKAVALMRKLKQEMDNAAGQKRRRGMADDDEGDDSDDDGDSGSGSAGDGSGEAEEADEDEDAEIQGIIKHQATIQVRKLNEKFSNPREERAVRFFRKLCSPAVGAISVAFLLFFFAPLCVVLPAVSVVSNDSFASQVDGVTGASAALLGTAAAPLVFTLALLLTKTLRRRNPLRNLGDNPMHALVDMAKREGLPTWDVGEWPNWSIGHGVATSGLRPRRSPYLHRGHRVDVRRAAVAFFCCVIFPLSVTLPLAIHAQDQMAAVDRGAGVREGTSLTICWAVTVGYPGSFLLFYGARLLWNVVPRPLRRAAPWLALWVALYGAVPLLFNFVFLRAAEGIFAQVMTLWLLLSPTSVAVALFLLVSRNLPSITRWVKSIRVEKPYRDMLSLLGLQYGLMSAWLPPVVAVWGALLYANWDGHSSAALAAFTMATLILSSAWSALLIYGLASAVYLDLLRPDAGMQHLLPVATVLAGLGLASYAFTMVDGWAHRGIPVSGDDFASLRWVEYATVTACMASACVAAMLRSAGAIMSEKRRFGYHPTDVERADPLVAKWFALADWRMEEMGLRKPLDSTNDADAREDAYYAQPSEDDESGDEAFVDVAQLAHTLRASSLFRALSATKAQQVINAMWLRSFGKGDHILKQGERGATFYILTAGRVKVTRIEGADVLELSPEVQVLAQRYDMVEEHRLLDVVEPVASFGELGLLSNVQRTANVVALVACECLEIDQETFFAVIGERAIHDVYKSFGVMDLYWRQKRERDEAARRAVEGPGSSSDNDDEDGGAGGTLQHNAKGSGRATSAGGGRGKQPDERRKKKAS